MKHQTLSLNQLLRVRKSARRLSSGHTSRVSRTGTAGMATYERVAAALQQLGKFGRTTRARAMGGAETRGSPMLYQIAPYVRKKGYLRRFAEMSIRKYQQQITGILHNYC